MKLQERYATIEDLITNHKKYLDSDCHQYSDGWRSTCIETPEQGGIFMDIENSPVVTFSDKYRRKHTGILTSFYYEKYADKILCTVRSTTVNPFYNGDNLVDGAMSYLISLKQAKLISGEMPKTPNKPTFK